MARCLKLAFSKAGHTSPNPMVGAVIVRDGKIIATGAHDGPGKPHAEIVALQKIKFKAEGATLYCNLEPCFHHGRTPPCVHEVIRSGVKRVVIGQQDPNPKVNGRSIRLLRKSGIQVTVGVLEKDCRRLNRAFIKWITTGLPYVIAKLAVSTDGKITLPGKKTGWLTNAASRRRVHEMRSQVDAIITGIGTILADDPQLNVRGIKHAHQPRRLILDSKGRVPASAKIFSSKGGPVEVVKNQELTPILQKLGREGVLSVLVEAGARVFASFVNAGLVDEIVLFVAPRVCGPTALDGFKAIRSKARYRLVEVVKRQGDLEIVLDKFFSSFP